MVWLTSTNMLVTIITLIIIAGIFDAWTNGYCKLRKTAVL
jgi:hypothetical protein